MERGMEEGKKGRGVWEESQEEEESKARRYVRMKEEK